MKGPEPRAPEREIPRPQGAGVGARPEPIVLDGFALFLLGDPRALPEESKSAMRELLGIDVDEVAGGAEEREERAVRPAWTYDAERRLVYRAAKHLALAAARFKRYEVGALEDLVEAEVELLDLIEWMEAVERTASRGTEEGGCEAGLVRQYLRQALEDVATARRWSVVDKAQAAREAQRALARIAEARRVLREGFCAEWGKQGGAK